MTFNVQKRSVWACGHIVATMGLLILRQWHIINLSHVYVVLLSALQVERFKKLLWLDRVRTSKLYAQGFRNLS